MSEKKEQDDRPDRTTLPGMIWNASHILDQALDPKCKGIPRQLLEGCKGVAIISVVEAGFIFSGHAGTGVLLARRQDGSWSPPSALGLAGVGFGALFGAAIKDVIILLVDDEAINSFTAMNTIKLGGEVGVAVGPVGREMSGDYNISGKGAGQALSYTFSKGLFAGVGLEGAILRGRATDKCEMWTNVMISEPPLSFPSEVVSHSTCPFSFFAHEFHRMKGSTDSLLLRKRYFSAILCRHLRKKESRNYIESWRSCGVERHAFHPRKSKRRRSSSDLTLTKLETKLRPAKAQMLSMSLPQISQPRSEHYRHLEFPT